MRLQERLRLLPVLNTPGHKPVEQPGTLLRVVLTTTASACCCALCYAVRLGQNIKERKQLRQQQNEQQQQLLHQPLQHTFSPLGPTALWQGRLAGPDLLSAQTNTLQMNKPTVLQEQQQARLQGQFGKAGHKISADASHLNVDELRQDLELLLRRV
jgi:hypothetical protein